MIVAAPLLRPAALPLRDLDHAERCCVEALRAVMVGRAALDGSAPLGLLPATARRAALRDAAAALSDAQDALGRAVRAVDVLRAEEE